MSRQTKQPMRDPVRRRWSRKFLQLPDSTLDFPDPEEPPPVAAQEQDGDQLIASLDIAPDVEDAWAAEVERRHAEVESGAVSLLPGPEALTRLKAEFQQLAARVDPEVKPISDSASKVGRISGPSEPPGRRPPP